MAVVAPIAGASAIVPVVFGILTGDRPSPVAVRGDRVRARRRRARLAGAPGGRRAARRRRRRPRAARGGRLRLLLPAMHAAGEADPLLGLAHLPHRPRPLIVAAGRRWSAGRRSGSAAGSSRSSLARRPRRHARQLPLRRRSARGRARQPHLGARLALPDRHGAARRGRAARAGRAVAARRASS